ncbi:SusC/RagA family TonB-linked outer membrane protein [Prevotella melaninogenica]|uniref:SusC/RagA family TonB-linked outer membrane protein n=1 Tax=Prevotella TaxID=838 RepID=UPI0003AD6EF5|nr:MULTISPECIES: SusC/RagA family TonB-linked outer membrane protein [Prevotella]ERJ76997.1 TonB-dependent receptor [Prevotella sp. F0091]QUB73912.1 SusC/RagA family TonB-linked outer membrane protein [Prevotella melaninogenica]
MNRQYILTRSLVCCLLVIGVTDVANAQRRHKAITTEQRQPLFLVNDTLPVIGSMAKVGEKQMNKGLVNSAINALSGQAVGVNVVTNGQDRMAMLTSVRVRGTTSLTGGNDPLVLIDGVSSDLATLSTIYPADIESFTILKNASETSKYGSRGASGVIEVKTRRGNGSKFQIYYDGAVGFDKVYKRLRMLNAAEYISAAKALGLDYVDKGYDTDFQKEIVRIGFVNSHHVAFSGGSDKSNYRASLGYVRGQTVIKTKDYNNFMAKLDISQFAFDEKLKIDFGVFGSSQQDEKIFDLQALSYSIAAMNPTLPFHKTGNGWQRNGNASQIGPTEPLLFERNDEKNLTFNSHLQLSLQLTHNLQLAALGSYSYTSTENGRFAPTWVWAQGLAYRGERKTEDMLGNISLDWKYRWGINNLSATILAEYQKKKIAAFWTQVKGLTNNYFGYDNLGAASDRPYGGTGSSYADPSLASFMGTLTYTLLDRYTLNLTTRADGSSMVGKDHTWGIFPSISATWDMKKESFLRNNKSISLLNLRTGYGQSGNLGGISSYLTLKQYIPVGLIPYNGTPTVTMGTLRNSNPDLRWETRSTFNIGADLGFFKNRLLLTAEYYYSKTTDMLYEYDVPVPTFAFDKLLANIGSMSNSGFELGIGIVPISKKDMELNVNINMAWQKNKLLSLNGKLNGRDMTASDITPIGGMNGAGFHGGYNDIIYQIVGQPLGVFYLPHCKGIVDNGHGHNKYDIADLNNDNVIDLSDHGDRYVAGQATPKMTLGSNISFRYKVFDISLQMNGAFGHKIFNGTALSYLNMSNFPDYNVLAEAPARNIVDQNVTDYWLERGDYLNFDYLTIGWNTPVRNKYISSLRVSFSINNLATITSYSGLTPIINSYVVDNTLGIDDKRTYPPYRTYSIGVSIKF